MKRIENISIQNFKSLKEVVVRECKTFNLLIGRPNVGKSNIIEALSCLAIPYLYPMKKTIGPVFRIERSSALFYNGNVATPIDINVGDYGMSITCFGVMRTGIELILDDKLEQRHKEEKKKKAIETMAKLKATLKKDDANDK